MPEWTILLAELVFTAISSAIVAAYVVGKALGKGEVKVGPTPEDLRRVQAEFENDLRDIRVELIEKLDRECHNYGEAISAIRTKIEQFELWSRDNLACQPELNDAIAVVREINRRLEQLAGLTVKVDALWDFMMDRAKIEAQQRGFMKRGSPR